MQYVTVRLVDGLVCSLPTDRDRAAWIAVYLMSVTDEQYTIRRQTP